MPDNTEIAEDLAAPFGYYVERRLADPVFLRRPAWIPGPSDNCTVTPLYATTPKPAADARELDRLEALLGEQKWAADWAHDIVPPGKPAHELACAAIRALPILIASARATAHLAGEIEARDKIILAQGQALAEHLRTIVDLRAERDAARRRNHVNAEDAEQLLDRTIAAERSRDAAVAIAEECGRQFAFYAREHTAAGKIEKAATNQHFADLVATLTEGKSHAG